MLGMIKEAVETPIGTYMQKLLKEKEVFINETYTTREFRNGYIKGYKQALDDILEAIERS